MASLFQPYDLSGFVLPNRIVMAPMTRSRSPSLVPNASTALYYAQRASAGLIISEGIPITPEGRGYLFTPGIYDNEQIKGWRLVTDAVHMARGRIYAQLWHVGRISHTSLQPGRGQPVSSVSTVAATSTAFAYDENEVAGKQLCSVPRALATEEVSRLVQDFVKAGLNSIDAGFDGIELHGANGYIFEQFISDALNDRTDEYGGSIENRLRFLLEVIDATIDAIGDHRVGLRISPFGRLHDMQPFDTEAETWLALMEELNKRPIAYLHLSDQHTIGGAGLPGIPADFLKSLRQAFTGTLMAAGGFDKTSGQEALDAGLLDLIAIGRPFISNPDLVERLENDWPTFPADRGVYYGEGDSGYIDYPRYKRA
ncbi:alkene reductase [Agrobacterium sp. S2/73]|nr:MULTISPECIES: alkene reductase [Rhizobium/Agrobacterium group]MBO9112628.1 alkene reductase [Agrobacterium sp. S2/73]QXZ76618.1 alkene reductase [Agrobacterium sp. S7/73]QYA17347.1 alkene reductase [Rhizobium sp. AB2/73]UEQ85660.1 alkene reductase [Rhizobium sp. AB2/73]